MFLSALTTHYFSKLRQFSEHSRWCFPTKFYDVHVDFVKINKKLVTANHILRIASN